MFYIVQCDMKHEKLRIVHRTKAKAFADATELSMMPQSTLTKVTKIIPCGSKVMTILHPNPSPEKNVGGYDSIMNNIKIYRSKCDVSFVDTEKGVYRPTEFFLAHPPKTTFGLVPTHQASLFINERMKDWLAKPKSVKTFSALYFEVIDCGGFVFGW